MSYFKRLLNKKTESQIRKPFIDGIGRNWDISLRIPKKYRNEFINACLSGVVDLEYKGEKNNVLLCAQPKSASLYFAQLLASGMDYMYHQIGFNKAGGTIYFPRLLSAKFVDTNTVSHCHNEPDKHTVQMIRTLNFKTIILTRNLLDTIISRRDMLVKDKYASNIISMAAVNQFLSSSSQTQIDIIIDLFAASYINFYTGWKSYSADEKIKPIFVTYEQVHSDPIETVIYVAHKLNEKIDREYLKQVNRKIMEKGGINFNKGQIGWGKQLIDERQIEGLRQLAIFLGCHDEEFLGFKL